MVSLLAHICVTHLSGLTYSCYPIAVDKHIFALQAARVTTITPLKTLACTSLPPVRKRSLTLHSDCGLNTWEVYGWITYDSGDHLDERMISKDHTLRIICRMKINDIVCYFHTMQNVCYAILGSIPANDSNGPYECQCLRVVEGCTIFWVPYVTPATVYHSGLSWRGTWQTVEKCIWRPWRCWWFLNPQGHPSIPFVRTVSRPLDRFTYISSRSNTWSSCFVTLYRF